MNESSRQSFLNLIYVGRHFGLDAKRLSLIEYMDLIAEMSRQNVKNNADDYREI